MITLLNTSILTNPGAYVLADITLEEAKTVLSEDSFESAIWHERTAAILTDLLGVEVRVNRVVYQQQTQESAIVFKLNCRLPEVKILSREEIETIGYKFQLLTRLT